MIRIGDYIRKEPEYAPLLRAVELDFRENPLPILVSGLCEGASLAFLSSLLADTAQLRSTPALVLCPDEKDCRRVAAYLSGERFRAGFYPARDLTFYHMTASHEYEHERLALLSSLLDGELDAVVTTPDAALGLTIPRERLAASRIRLSADEPVDPVSLAARLVAAGFVRADLVDAPGQFALRGGIIDIYPPYASYLSEGERLTGAQPLRMELFGDEIDRMGIFDPETQRLVRDLSLADLCPAREVLADADARDAVRRAAEAQLKKAAEEPARDELRHEIALLSAASEGGAELGFLDKYLPLIYPEGQSLLDYFSSRGLVVVRGTAAVKERLAAFEEHEKTVVKELVAGGTVAKKNAVYAKPSSVLEDFYGAQVSLFLDSIARGGKDRRLSGFFTFRTRHTVATRENENLFLEDLHGYVRGGSFCVVEAENAAAKRATEELLVEADFVLAKGEEALPGTVLVTDRAPLPGFELSVPKIVVLSLGTPADALRENRSALAGRFKKHHKQRSILSYNDLSEGDYVVHEDFGIGQYLGIERLTSDGSTRDYVAIRYAGAGKLYLPVEKLDKVAKYIGARAEDGTVKLSSLGGDAWGKTKKRASAAAAELAKDLIKLYAERQRLPGHAFPADDAYQKAFEDAFEYEETESQEIASGEIKRDMMRPVPMDRLLCGDVGYGKTEVALRAAYKAILGGKQVAILVPTTLLALQHYQTIESRMRSFAVSAEMLSRFRTPREQALSLRRLARGEADIVVGTHRLLSSDVKFHDLGLLIVDEEQRFGVAQKEKLKQLAHGVDVLSLSATPIPRTLNMALGGIRDISVLDEAPGDRLPVQTYVLEEDPLILEEAMRRELRRGGQVFYLHNSVETIYSVGERVAKAIPTARVVVAHGQMDKEDLESIWAEMLAGKIDILVCTTIIETGVDIPNANTLIVSNAQRLGLSQLHQIRGRIGRSSRRAYAYFTFPQSLALSDVAAKRLSAIREYAEFGAGFKIALRDMEIRGAGNLLGAEQHGHLEAVGYDLYIKLLNRAVLEERGESLPAVADCNLSIRVDAYIPDRYIPFPAQRMAIYKKIALIASEEDLSDVADELLDRFGELPRPTLNLLQVGLVHTRAVRLGLSSIREEGSVLYLFPERFDMDLWADLAKHYQLRVVPSKKPHLKLLRKDKEDALTLLAALLKDALALLSKGGTPV